jgi:mannose-6-phosphate isomerase-like protein (cupin superfamily)
VGRAPLSAGGSGDLLESVGQVVNLSHKGALIVDIRNLDRVPAFVTKDGSEIRELLAHRNSCIRRQTLAEARLPPGAATTPHQHVKTEEIYYILEGSGLMRVADVTAEVGPGDAVAIPPGTSHQITNTGPATLKFLCCCAPGYEDEDTFLERGEGGEERGER